MASSNLPETSIPAGSTVLVTGATGFIASHVVGQLLAQGFKVRGSVRDFHSASWLLSSHIEEARSGQLELVTVPDIAVDGAFDEAVKGVSGILHIATSTASGEGGGFQEDPEVAVPVTVKGMSSIFMSALKEESIKEFVFTGTIVSALFPLKIFDTVVGPDTWNEAAIEAAYSPPPYGPLHGFQVYSAAKTITEKEFLKLQEENKPHFNCNVVSPSGVIGEPKHVKHADPHHNWVRSLYIGDKERLDAFPCAYFVDVKDIALIHVAALLDPSVQGQRLQAWGRSLNWNLFLKELRELRPHKEWIPDFSDPGFLTLSTDQSVPEMLLQKWGQKTWAPLGQTLAENLNNPYFKFGVEQ